MHSNIQNNLVQQRKLLLSSFYLNGHNLGFYQQTWQVKEKSLSFIRLSLLLLFTREYMDTASRASREIIIFPFLGWTCSAVSVAYYKA